MSVSTASGGESLSVANEQGRMRRVLGIPSLVFFGLAYMVPLTVWTTYGVVTTSTGGHLPAAYVVTTLAMLLTAASYGRMVAAYPVAGSAYAYTRGAFGGKIGFLVGWVLLLDYLFLPMICYLVIGLYVHDYVPAVPMWVWVVGSVVAVTTLNVLGIKVITGVNLTVVVAQFIFIAIFVGLSVAKVVDAAHAPSFTAPFVSSGMNLHAVVAGSAVLALSFLGFDAVSTLSEETPDPTVRIPRAIVLCAVAGGGLYLLQAYVGHLVFP
ncbi:APC family permease, partial [Streptomyces sp. NPDC056728]